VHPCAYRKLGPNVVIMETAEHWNCCDRAGVMGCAMDWRVFVQRAEFARRCGSPHRV
jgi:hypothetical protein